MVTGTTPSTHVTCRDLGIWYLDNCKLYFFTVPKGLMQLMPTTARRLGVRDSCNIEQNISGGVRYLAWLMRLFHNDLRLVAAGYHAGEDIVARRGLSYHNRDVVSYVARIRASYVLEAGVEDDLGKTTSRRVMR